MSNATVAGRSVIKQSAGTVTSVVVNTPPLYGDRGWSLHDCSNPGQAGVHNCIYPVGNPPGSPIVHRVGIVLHTKEPGGSFVVTFT